MHELKSINKPTTIKLMAINDDNNSNNNVYDNDNRLHHASHHDEVNPNKCCSQLK